MADPYKEFIKAIKSTISNSTTFSEKAGDRLYYYMVPSSASYPYVTAFDISFDNWMTLGNIESGEVGSARFITHGYLDECSISDIQDITNSIDSSLHLKSSLAMDNYTLVSLKRTTLSKPIQDPEDEKRYFQYIDFDVRLQSD